MTGMEPTAKYFQESQHFLITLFFRKRDVDVP